MNCQSLPCYHCDWQTAALAMNYFDRYCSALVAEEQPIPRDRVQLMSMVCLLLASKFFDRHTPSVADMCKIAQHIYTADEFRAMELEVLTRLQHQVREAT